MVDELVYKNRSINFISIIIGKQKLKLPMRETKCTGLEHCSYELGKNRNNNHLFNTIYKNAIRKSNDADSFNILPG